MQKRYIIDDYNNNGVEGKDCLHSRSAKLVVLDLKERDGSAWPKGGCMRENKGGKEGERAKGRVTGGSKGTSEGRSE